MVVVCIYLCVYSIKNNSGGGLFFAALVQSHSDYIIYINCIHYIEFIHYVIYCLNVEKQQQDEQNYNQLNYIVFSQSVSVRFK